MKDSVINFFKNHLDFKCYPVTWVAILNFILIIPCLLWLPERFGYENGLLENLQIIVLGIGACLAIKSKGDRKFFYFVLMVISILFLREINCGRTIFFPVPGVENTFYGWKEIKYGWLAHPIFGTYIAYVVFYFLYNKVYLTLWNIIRKVKFPVWNVLLLIVGMSVGMYAEKALENMVLEEITELLFYVSLAGIIYLYGFNKNFLLKTEDSDM